MKESLKKNIDRVKDEHAEQEFQALLKNADESAIRDTIFILGQIKHNDRIANAFHANLSAQSIRALETVQKLKRHEVMGYATFEQLLTESPYSPMSKRQYYDRLALLRKHGDEIYDLLTSIGISVRAQKQLGNGELCIKNNSLYIGDKEVEIADAGLVKEVLSELFDEKRKLQIESEKKDKAIDTLHTSLKKGEKEYEELRRNFDAAFDVTPFQRQLMRAVQGLSLLTETVGQLSDEEKKRRGDGDMKLLAGLWFRVREAYGSMVPLAESTEIDEDFLDRAIREIAQDDDWGDEPNK